MQIQLTGKKIEITPSLREMVDEKIQHGIGRFATRITNIEIVLKADKLNQTAVQATLHLHGTVLHAESTSTEIESAIDTVADKLAKQLAKHKDKQTNHR